MKSPGVLFAALPLVLGCHSNSQIPAVNPANPDTVRVLAYNIHHGEGMDEVVDLERIAAIIRDVDPDLVALQEMDSVVARTGGVDQAAKLGELTGLEDVFGRFMPYQGGAYGMALLSRWPISDVQNARLPDGDEPRTALNAIVTSPDTGRRIRLVGVHLYRTEEERLAQAVALEDHLAGEPHPTLLAGDFNSTPGSPVMDHLASSWEVVHKGVDRFTFSSYEPVREIDFFLYRPSSSFQVLDQQLLTEPVASDHRPLVIDLIVRD
ncbi:MAG: endonuclease/exonuclease/phosphatase family protein [Longimicrobiales bacterium]